MTVSVPSDTEFRYEGNGATTFFSYPARVFSTSDLVVQLVTRATDAIEETLTLTTHYSVTITSSGNAEVTITSAPKIPSASQDIFISRSVAASQTVDLPTGTVFPAKNVEDALDKAIVLIQDLQTGLERAAKIPAQTLLDLELPLPEADRIIGWNSTADQLVNYTPNTNAYLSASSYIISNVLSAASEAALKIAINAEAGIDFLAYSTEVDRYDNDWVDIASATTTDIGAATSRKVRITGTTTITGLGTVASGTERIVRFAGALTLTHNGTSLILPGSSNITTATNDTMYVVSLGAGNWIAVDYKKASGLSIITPAAPAPNTYQATPSDPSAAGSTTATMAGLAGSITPSGSGKIMVTICGHVDGSGSSTLGVVTQIRYGTGTAPTNGAAETGTASGSAIIARDSTIATNRTLPFSLTTIISGLTLSTAYWIDLAQAQVSGVSAAALKSINISIFEIS